MAKGNNSQRKEVKKPKAEKAKPATTANAQSTRPPLQIGEKK